MEFGATPDEIAETRASCSVFSNVITFRHRHIFAHGPSLKSRFMLAPLTNSQSASDGTLSDEEYRWLTMRAEGGFALTMTCASHVQAVGQGFLGIAGLL